MNTQEIENLMTVLRARRRKIWDERHEAEGRDRMDVWNNRDGQLAALSLVIGDLEHLIDGGDFVERKTA